MLLEWRITDNIATLSVQEFDAEWNGIYGFMQTSIFDVTLGFIPPATSGLEGNDNILYWMTIMVECGLCILQKKEYEAQLLSYNLLRLNIQCKESVHIDLIKAETGELYMHKELSYDEAMYEIISNAKRFESFVDKNNPSLRQAKLIQLFTEKLSVLQNELNLRRGVYDGTTCSG